MPAVVLGLVLDLIFLAVFNKCFAAVNYYSSGIVSG